MLSNVLLMDTPIYTSSFWCYQIASQYDLNGHLSGGASGSFSGMSFSSSGLKMQKRVLKNSHTDSLQDRFQVFDWLKSSK